MRGQYHPISKTDRNAIRVDFILLKEYNLDEMFETEYATTREIAEK